MGKYLIFGATGSIGSKLSENMHESDKEVHLIGRDEEDDGGRGGYRWRRRRLSRR